MLRPRAALPRAEETREGHERQMRVGRGKKNEVPLTCVSTRSREGYFASPVAAEPSIPKIVLAWAPFVLGACGGATQGGEPATGPARRALPRRARAAAVRRRA